MAPRFYLLLDRMIRSVNFMIFVHEWMYYFNGFALDPWLIFDCINFWVCNREAGHKIRFPSWFYLLFTFFY